MTSPTWPLGPVLERAREDAGLSKRAAAKRAGISEQLWRRLETGYYTVQGRQIPLGGTDGENKGARPETLRDVALAVGLNVREVLALVGYEPTAADPKADPLADAEDEFRALYATFERAWGPDKADAVMRRVYRDRHGKSTGTSESVKHSPDSEAG